MLDLFCGTGALSYGIETYSSHLITVGGIDADPSAARTAALNHPSAKVQCERIESIRPEDMLAFSGVSEIDVIVGGPPCQGFSSLRPSRGAGLDDPRNSLYQQFLNYVRVLRPRVFLMENVVGILSAGDGKLVSEMLAAFSRLGYSVDWRVLNAANFGVPQKRERFFLVGMRKNLGAKLEPQFPIPSHWFAGRVIGTRLKEKYIINRESGNPPVTVRDAISDLPSISSGEFSTAYTKLPLTAYQAARRRSAPSELTLHIAAAHNAKMLEVIKHSGTSIQALPEGLVSSGYSSCYSRLAFDEPSTTITVKFTSPASSKCIHPIDNRAITPREAARIQSFDDAFAFAGSKTDIASQIGNAVPPLFGAVFAPVLETMLNSQGIGEY
jgi:DNA (cytosine-5)-methyltransferase 1